jgi:hypothetical protein
VRKFRVSTLIATSLVTLTLPVWANKLDVPIIEHGEWDGVPDSEIQDILPTCGLDRVTGLDPHGEGFLAVRSGPGSQYRKLAELHNGDDVLVFDQKDKWYGVVYGDTSFIDCISPRTRPIPYPNKGWVHSNWLKHIAP